MSYTRTYTKRIAVHYSGSVSYSYPASQNGGYGSASYSGVAYEDVAVNIEVDTVPFERGVEDCARHVDVLTGSVVATQAAQVESIQQKAEQIGNTIVDGFFNTVRFEIATQITELKKRVDALLLDMNEKQKKLQSLQNQMQRDYHRTTERYGHIFGELNKELENRVHALDQSVFTIADEMYNAEDRFMETDMLNIVAIAGKESAILDAQIGTALAKEHARVALNEANSFLAKKQATEITLSHCKLDDNKDCKYYAPVCYAFTKDEHDVIEANAYPSEFLPSHVSSRILQELELANLPDLQGEDKEHVDLYFRSLLNESEAQSEHESRVKNTILKLYSL